MVWVQGDFPLTAVMNPNPGLKMTSNSMSSVLPWRFSVLKGSVERHTELYIYCTVVRPFHFAFNSQIY